MAKSPTALYKEKMKFVDSSLDRFDNDLRKLQASLFDVLVTEYIVQLDVKNGVVQLTQKNARLLADLDKVMKEFKRTQSLAVFGRLGNNMVKMTGLTSQYFNALVGGKKTIANIADKLERYSTLVGIDKKGAVISGSFIDNLAEGGQMQTRLSDYMRRAVEGQSDYKTFVKGLKDIVKGGDGINGAYERYVGGYAHDTFFAQSRQQDNFFAEQLGLEYFMYVGEIIKDSRPFCIARHGKVFSREQGEEWNSLDWQGKIPDIDFFDQCGGYNCRHQIQWITDDLAGEKGVEEITEE
jgi:hypothetical protein